MPATRKRVAKASAAKETTQTNISIDVAVADVPTETEKTGPEQVKESIETKEAAETQDTGVEEEETLEGEVQPDGDDQAMATEQVEESIETKETAETLDTGVEEEETLEGDVQPDGDDQAMATGADDVVEENAEAEANKTEDTEVPEAASTNDGNVKTAEDNSEMKPEMETEEELGRSENIELNSATGDDATEEANVADSSKVDAAKPETNAASDSNGGDTSPPVADVNKEDATDETGAVEASVTPKKKQYTNMAEFLEDNPYPESLAKLRQLTVNIGPIKQNDLMSVDLGKILNLNNEFEIKFSLRDKETSDGTVKKEKLGFVRIPFTIRNPQFLVKVAEALGSLHIDGRDMSVKFPEAFNTTLKECKAYAKKEVAAYKDVRKYRQELKSRQILLKQVPAGTDEESIRSLFPEASKVSMNTVKNKDGIQTLSSVLLDFDTLGKCKKFYETNKDVQIGDSKVVLIKFYKGDQNRSGQARGGLARGRGARRGAPFTRGGSAGSAGRGRASAGQAAVGQFGSRPFGVKSRMAEIKKTRELLASRGGRGRGVTSNSRNQRSGLQNARGQGASQASSILGAYPSGKNRRAGSGQFGSLMPGMSRQSPGRNQMTSPNRNTQFAGSQASASRGRQSEGEDPMAMMQYLKSTLARMEQKISHSQSQGGGRDGGFGRDRRNSGGSGFSRMQQDSYSRGGGGNDSFHTSPGGNRRKRRKNSFGGNKPDKRPYMQQQQPGTYPDQSSRHDASTSNIWDNYNRYAESVNRYNVDQNTSRSATATSGGYNYRNPGTSNSSSYFGSQGTHSQASSNAQQSFGQPANYYY